MKSMTGFGRGEVVAGGWRFAVEMAAVNRKQSDISLNLPREWQEVEAPLRQLVAEKVSRGRVNVSVSVERTAGPQQAVRVDEALARHYAEAMASLAQSLGQPLPLTAGDLLRAPGVVTLESSAVSCTDMWPQLEQAAQKALAALEKFRAAEGAALKKDLEGRLAALREVHGGISAHAPKVTAHHRTALQRRLAEAGLPLPLDDERLLREIALFAERCDVSEELARFACHLDQCTSALAAGEPAGRTLDFLCQELHRELNTMGSKANDAAIAHLVVAGKGEVEKLREQVQNIE